jgi:diguanylate cyclase (GGDEF)-like protein
MVVVAVVIRFVALVDVGLTTILVGSLGLCALTAGWWFYGRGRSSSLRRSWLYISASVVVTAASTIVSTNLPADVTAAEVLRIAAATAAVVGLLGLIHQRLADKAAEALGEAVLVATAAGYVLFSLVVAPGSHGGWGTGRQFVALAVPLVDLVAIWLAARLIWLTERQPVAYRYLIVSFASVMVGDSVTTGGVLGHHALLSGDVTAVNLWAVCVAGAAALHPSRRAPFEPVPLRHASLTKTQFAAVAVTLAVVPVVFAVVLLRHEPLRPSVVIIGSALLPLLASAYLVRQVFARAAAEYRAQHDPLTGVCNRALFEDRLDAALEQAKRTGGRVGVMFLDLDRFKTVNDSLGHAVGNQLLIQVAGRLQSCIRPKDTVARLGGDEFTLVLPAVADKKECVAVAERVLGEFTTSFAVGGRPMNVKASIGIAVFPDDGATPDSLMKNADTAMYRAKAAGRGAFVVYDKVMSSRAQLRYALEASLRLAITREQLDVHYQPKVEAATGRIVGVEALARWQHPRLGFISPGAFISLAEETGHIAAVGEWVLEEACRQARRWEIQGTRMPVSVNMSSSQFEQTPVVEVVTRVLNRTGLDPSLLELEVTENLLVKDVASVTRSLRELRAIGVRWSIDDFGTGYSALSYLAEMPVSTLKIDRSFIDRLGSEARQSAIVSAVIALAHSLDLDVVAEGVETREQLLILQQEGCEQVQGYLFSPAMPAEQFDRFLAAGARPVGRMPTPLVATADAARPVVAPAVLNSLLESIVAENSDEAALNFAVVEAVLGALHADQPMTTAATRRLQRIPARLAVGTFGGLVPLSGGLAAAGALPAPLQAAAAEVFHSAGIVIPATRDSGQPHIFAVRAPIGRGANPAKGLPAGRGESTTARGRGASPSPTSADHPAKGAGGAGGAHQGSGNQGSGQGTGHQGSGPHNPAKPPHSGTGGAGSGGQGSGKGHTQSPPSPGKGAQGQGAGGNGTGKGNSSSGTSGSGNGQGTGGGNTGRG